MDYVTITAIHRAAAALSISGFFARSVGSLATFGTIVSVAIFAEPNYVAQAPAALAAPRGVHLRADRGACISGRPR